MVVVRRALLLVLGTLLFYGVWRLTSANSEPVDVDFLWLSFHEVPLWAALGLAFVTGALLTAAFSTLEIARKNLVARRYRKAVGRLEAEVHQLRSLPLSRFDEPPGASEAVHGESDA